MLFLVKFISVEGKTVLGEIRLISRNRLHHYDSGLVDSEWKNKRRRKIVRCLLRPIIRQQVLLNVRECV